MSQYVVLLLFNFAISWVVASWVIRHAVGLKLVQAPNHRSSHALPTPNGGGLGVVVASLVAVGWLASSETGDLVWLLPLGLPLAVVGLLDDIRFLPAKVRLTVHFAVVVGLLALAHHLPAFDLFGFSIEGRLLLVGMVLAGMWWINLFNFMDGIDGLAGVQAISMLGLSMLLAAWVRPDVIGSPMWILAISLGTATFGFLLLNWPPAKVFMGDVGSTWLAFMILAVALLSIQAGWLTYKVWLILAAVFVSDTTVTLCTRMLRGERWYEAHCIHAYQKLARRWGGERKVGHRSVTLLVLAINLVWLAPLACAAQLWPHHSSALLLAAYAPLLVGVIWLGAGRLDRA